MTKKRDKKVYVYRLTADTGLAPCVEDGLLSLAVCKGGQIRKGVPCNTGLRHLIGHNKEYDSKDVYILGTYQNKLLYMARITKVLTMTEYFSEIGKKRTDGIFSVKNGTLVRNNHLRDKDVHTEPERIIKDIAGEYVLLSEDYIYLGKDATEVDILTKYNARFQETKTYEGKDADTLVAACEKYRDKKNHIPHEPFNNRCGG